MDERLHAVVTGGGRGIGRAVAVVLSQAGMRVTVLGRTETALVETVAAGEASGHAVVDVTDAAALHAALRGRVDVLVNNAGTAESAPFAEQDRAVWDRALLLNLTAAYEGCRAVLPGMVARGFGRIVNVSSTAGLVGYPFVAAYCAAKHGLVGLTRALALEVARSGVTVNAVCPGFTDTELVSRAAAAVAARTGKPAEAVAASYARFNPQGRLVQPAEVAEAVRFLCGPQAGAMTGQALAVAGGEVM